MIQENVVLCGANAYKRKYYFNPDFAALPPSVQDELQIMCVLYTEDVGGSLFLEFDGEGSLRFRVESLEGDARFDEIGSELKIRQIRREKEELLKSLEMYYRAFCFLEGTET